jgi:predicted RNA-binding protein (virulence factor B family)
VKYDPTIPLEHQTREPLWLENGAHVWVSIRRDNINNGNPAWLKCRVVRAFGDAAYLEPKNAKLGITIYDGLWRFGSMRVLNDSPWAHYGGNVPKKEATP